MNKTVEFVLSVACWVAIILICGLLFGCTRQTPVDSAFSDANQAIVIVKKSLPKECQTEEILQKIDSVKIKYEKAQSVCEAKIKDVQIKYERTLWVIFIIIFVFFAKKFIKI